MLYRPAICLFYLILRGLDTVEDDPSIESSFKIATLRKFHENLYCPGWNFTGCGVREKDRDLLVEFEVVRLHHKPSMSVSFRA